jgi:integrase
MPMQKHTILDGKCHVYRRAENGNWQCSAFVDGKNHRVSTGTDSLRLAKEFASDWYLTLRGKQRAGTLNVPTGPTFRDTAKKWEAEYAIITGGNRNAIYVDGNSRRLTNYLLPFFGDLTLAEVTSAKVHEYRVQRLTPAPGTTKVPAKQTLHQEIVVLRQVLKYASRHNLLASLPDMTAPYQKAEKISHRGWFSKPEYKALYEAARDKAKQHKGKRWQYNAEQFLDFILIMTNTGLRPDEAKRLQYRDIEVAIDQETQETILIIAVRGKRGVGYCKSTANAVFPFERMVERNRPQPSDLLFPTSMAGLMVSILDETKMRFDREGNRRSAYSLRHTYISMRLEEGADIYQVAKNCRTSVEMIEKFYAAHIKNNISAAAVNVRKKPLTKKQQEELAKRNAHLTSLEQPEPAAG